uniref:Uncharacterized protein n=1 Tax=Plectus sambesii TaxID=2011161 RepID=A0A914V3G5_9BILA
MLNGNYICKDVLEEHQKSSALDAVNSNSNTNNKEKKMVVKLFDVALDRTLTIVDFTLKTSQYVVATNFVIENYTNEKLVYVKMNVIHGEVPTDPRDIEPGEKLQFSSHKRSFATYGFCAIAIWQYKDRFIVVICQVPLTAVGGVNTLSIGITKPGVKYTNLTVPSDKSFEAHYKSIKTGLSSSDSHYKAFQDCGYSDSIQDISVEDRDITITGRMGTLKNCVVEIEIIPHREDDFAPQLIKHARDYANK